MTNFIFDVDGTLTAPRQLIDTTFKEYMLDFTRMHTCYLCTGSDREKTLEQLGEELTNQFKQAFHCSGNHVFEQGKELYKSDWQLSGEEFWFLETELKGINYFEKTGNHIEKRIGTTNFSICGRNATYEQRQNFVKWESRNNKRLEVAKKFNDMFGYKSHAVVGGEISIDIFKLGCDKSQIRKHVLGDAVYFGDHCFPNGSDYAISKLCEVFHQIDNGWQQTFSILQNQYHNQ